MKIVYPLNEYILYLKHRLYYKNIFYNIFIIFLYLVICYFNCYNFYKFLINLNNNNFITVF